MVPGDKVDVVIGPVLMHTAAAVAAYCGSAGVPHIVFSSNIKDIMNNKTVFLPQGTGRDIQSITKTIIVTLTTIHILI